MSVGASLAAGGTIAVAGRVVRFAGETTARGSAGGRTSFTSGSLAGRFLGGAIGAASTTGNVSIADDCRIARFPEARTGTAPGIFLGAIFSSASANRSVRFRGAAGGVIF
jgi:hypothetical protein